MTEKLLKQTPEALLAREALFSLAMSGEHPQEDWPKLAYDMAEGWLKEGVRRGHIEILEPARA